MNALHAHAASVAASPFRMRKVDVGGIAAVELCDVRSGAYALIAHRGATLLDWRIPDRGELVALTDGYASAAELAGQDGVRNGILAPFPNRIADGRYRFDGRDHDLLPGVATEDRLIYHGFLREMDLAIADVRETATGASVLFTGAIESGAIPGYPFALVFNVRVTFTARSFGLVLTATNVGDSAAPYAAGWHPYFRLGDAKLASLELTVPATHCIVTDAKLLPLAGEAAFAPVADASMPDFRLPRQLGAAVLDGCYTDALPDADGLTRSRLRDPATGRQLTIWQRGGLTHVFTGDTLARDARRAIAIEPVEAMTDAFNRPECAAAIRLAPGATRSFACGADFDADSDRAPLSSTPLCGRGRVRPQMPGKNTKIIATVGPASADEHTLRTLAETGADVFRLNFSHGTHDDHRAVYHRIRALEESLGRPIGVLIDLQGPKLRLGTFADGGVTLTRGDRIRFDLDPAPGNARRVSIPHPEIIAAVGPGHELLVDDGKMRLQVVAKSEGVLEMEALTDGRLSDRKGVNVPDVALPLSALTAKDRRDLAFGLELGIDWVALSFVQRPADLVEARELIGDRALLMAKIEKPAALAELDQIIALADGVMVARGDLGVELPPEDVPGLQKRIVRLCRRAGKPVVVATQMLESMISAPAPTRAEASDVATAVFDGADAVMLSAETASGRYPGDALAMMSRIIARTESDPLQRQLMEAVGADPKGNTTDAIGTAIRAVTATLPVSATVAFTASGSTALRIAHQRPRSPILSLTPSQPVARRLCLVWGVRSRRSVDAGAVEEMVQVALEHCRVEGLTAPGQAVIVTAGVPFGTPGSTNLLRLAWPAGEVAT